MNKSGLHFNGCEGISKVSPSVPLYPLQWDPSTAPSHSYLISIDAQISPSLTMHFTELLATVQ